MELQTDLESPQGLRWYQKSHPHGTSNWLGVSTSLKMREKIPPPWNFKLTWSAHKLKMISKFPPPWNFKLTGSPHKMIWKFPPPWNFKLTWSLHKVKRISNWGFKSATWSFTVSWSAFRDSQHPCNHLHVKIHHLSADFHSTSFTIAPSFSEFFFRVSQSAFKVAQS